MNIEFVTVATNVYIDYFRNLVESIHRSLPDTDNLRLHVFTNEVEKAELIANDYPGISLTVNRIPNLGWPDATLSRYKYLSGVASIHSGIVAYIDADMLINADVRKMLFSESTYGKMVFVEHPGYWRSKGWNLINFYLRHPSYLLRDLRTYILFGGIGSWETDTKSAAFVPRSHRSRYLCGGFWFGPSQAVGSFCDDQIMSIDKDFKNGIMAKWHDESHLNEWASRTSYRYLSPQYCFSESAENLFSLTPLIIAVEKKERTR